MRIYIHIYIHIYVPAFVPSHQSAVGTKIKQKLQSLSVMNLCAGSARHAAASWRHDSRTNLAWGLFWKPYASFARNLLSHWKSYTPSHASNDCTILVQQYVLVSTTSLWFWAPFFRQLLSQLLLLVIPACRPAISNLCHSIAGLAPNRVTMLVVFMIPMHVWLIVRP